MNLFTLLFRLPFLPFQGFIRLAEILRDEVDKEYYSPAAARRELEEAQRARESGEMSDEDVSRMEYDALSRMMAQPGGAPAGSGPAGEEG